MLPVPGRWQGIGRASRSLRRFAGGNLSVVVANEGPARQVAGTETERRGARTARRFTALVAFTTTMIPIWQ
jgi:hypothetical protein